MQIHTFCSWTKIIAKSKLIWQVWVYQLGEVMEITLGFPFFRSQLDRKNVMHMAATGVLMDACHGEIFVFLLSLCHAHVRNAWRNYNWYMDDISFYPDNHKKGLMMCECEIMQQQGVILNGLFQKILSFTWGVLRSGFCISLESRGKMLNLISGYQLVSLGSL